METSSNRRTNDHVICHLTYEHVISTEVNMQMWSVIKHIEMFSDQKYIWKYKL